jgi:hypothetical protein
MPLRAQKSIKATIWSTIRSPSRDKRAPSSSVRVPVLHAAPRLVSGVVEVRVRPHAVVQHIVADEHVLAAGEQRQEPSKDRVTTSEPCASQKDEDGTTVVQHGTEIEGSDVCRVRGQPLQRGGVQHSAELRERPHLPGVVEVDAFDLATRNVGGGENEDRRRVADPPAKLDDCIGRSARQAASR